ncbi:ABC transporter permease [Methylovorus sp. MM2]|uniref:ABC transporter permease n=1 Tax=Methylovorus sp. MM2 TaxID=1848038 RepID=UPI000A5A84EB|nr:FtsX-like permease family protein [Methylovorus sp. MM2]
MMALILALRQLRSHWAAGEVRVLLVALTLAVTATTSVAFFTDRIQSSIVNQGGVLLGADVVISADHALPDLYLKEAQRLQLVTTNTLEFPSMVVHGDANQLAEIKAVGEKFPLRGELTTSQQVVGGGHLEKDIPPLGIVWISPRLASLLNVAVGDVVEVGERSMQIGAILQREPSRGGEMFSIAPRLMMNIADVSSTGLLQYGSRARYQLLIAAQPDQVGEYSTWAKPQLGRGERIEDVASARPEIKSSREKAQQFLGLSAMVGVILAMVAMFLASLPYIQTSLDTYALMRCFGASKQLITRILLWQTLLLALIGTSLGCLLGFAAQAGLARLAGHLFLETLPPAGITPVLAGFVAGFATMLAVVWPHLQRLQNVPALRILRRDLGDMRTVDFLSFLPAFLVMAGLIFWHAGNWKLGGAALLGFIGLVLVAILLAWGGAKLLQLLPESNMGAWKLGLAGLKRRPGMAIAQVLGFSLGLTALILLALVRSDLLQNWQASLPVDAPNRFMINIQPEQVADVKVFLRDIGISDASIFPMVRGRLIAVNGSPLKVEKLDDDRAQRLAEREFNLSWAAEMQQDNQLVEGDWWQVSDAGTPQLSIEKGLADSLKLKLGDKLTYDIGGTQIDLTITSLRKVEWDSMRANFFALTPPAVLDGFSASYITSFHLPLGHENSLNQLVKRFPNVTIIDIAELLEQIREIMGKMTHAIEYVFGFSLLAGLAVLYAALIATRRDRVREATLLRVLGASRRQVTFAVLIEFFCIGLLAAIVATITASALAFYISTQLLSIDYQFNLKISLLVILVASILVPIAAWLGIRSFLNVSPRTLLHSV